MKRIKKKRGRPPKPRGERRSKNRTFRVRGNMDDYLIARAEEAGRSVSEEIEARLERSFYMDGIMTTFVGDAQPLLNALAMVVGVSLLKGPGGLDRYRVMQVATGYIIATFGSRNTATTASHIKVSDVRWPSPVGVPDRYELEGMKTAYWVLKNLGTEMPEEQIADLEKILGPKTPSILEIG